MTRALVLGGGGITGVAWEIGILTGLVQAGIDLRNADLVVGSSAGAIVGAQFTSGTPLEELYERQMRPPGYELTARIGLRVKANYVAAVLRTRDPLTYLKLIGKMSVSTPDADRRSVIASRLPVHQWPTGTDLKVTAVDAITGAFTVFDRTSGISMVDAVTASCAVPGVWPAVTIDGRKYMDGAVRSPANADLAEDASTVLVLAPIPAGFGPVPSAAAQISSLPGQAHLVTPDAATRKAIGNNTLDPARRGASARAGRAQAAAIASQIAALWQPDLTPS
jgi:NTE family protein